MIPQRMTRRLVGKQTSSPPNSSNLHRNPLRRTLLRKAKYLSRRLSQALSINLLTKKIPSLSLRQRFKDLSSTTGIGMRSRPRHGLLLQRGPRIPWPMRMVELVDRHPSSHDRQDLPRLCQLKTSISMILRTTN